MHVNKETTLLLLILLLLLCCYCITIECLLTSKVGYNNLLTQEHKLDHPSLTDRGLS